MIGGMRWLSALMAITTAGFVPAAGVGAAVITATPQTLNAVMAGARGGETIVLAPGQYGQFVWSNTGFSPAIRIDASRATFAGIRLNKTYGIDLSGGTLDGPREQTMGVLIGLSHHIRVSDMRLTRVRIGLSVDRSTDVEVVNNRFDALRSDGINIAMSRRVLIKGNSCRNFDPVRPIYAADGRLVKDGDHPDCIQGWSRRGYPPTADIAILDNVAEGFMQGILFNRQVIDGKDTGGYDRFVIKGNRMTVGYFHGITVEGVRGAEVSGNTVRATPGSRLLAYPFPLIRPWLRITGTGIVQCGNTIESYPRGPGTRRCR